MMHLKTTEAAAWRVSIKAIALSGPVFERAGRSTECCSNGTVAAAKGDVRARAAGGEIETVLCAAKLHAGEMIGEIEELAAGENGGARGGVEAEEPHAGFAAGDDVGADVDLGEGGKDGGGGKPTGTDVHHAERHDTDPRGAVEGIGKKAGWEVRTQRSSADAVVEKGEVEPRHSGGPRASGQWPRTVIGDAKKVGCVHGVFVKFSQRRRARVRVTITRKIGRMKRAPRVTTRWAPSLPPRS